MEEQSQQPTPESNNKGIFFTIITIIGFILYSVLGLWLLLAIAFSASSISSLISLALLVLWIILLFFGIKFFRKKITLFFGENTKLKKIIPVIIILLPLLIIGYVQIDTFFGVRKIDNEVEKCDLLFKDSFQVNSITSEIHNQGDKYITLNAEVTVQKPLYATPLVAIKDDKQNTIFSLYITDWDDGRPGTQFFDEGNHEFSLFLKLKDDLKNLPTNSTKYLIDEFKFLVNNDELCEYPVKVTAYGNYETHKYARGDFMSDLDKLMDERSGYLVAFTDGRPGSKEVIPSTGPVEGGTVVLLKDYFNEGELNEIKYLIVGEEKVTEFNVNGKDINLTIPPGKQGTVDIWVVKESSLKKVFEAFTYH